MLTLLFPPQTLLVSACIPCARLMHIILGCPAGVNAQTRGSGYYPSGVST